MLVTSSSNEKNLLARIMRAEALNEGNLGMLMVGNVVLNRVVANCYTFKDIHSITDAIYQKDQFTGINSSLFQAKPTTQEKRLVERVLDGEYYYPATNSLWFYAPNYENQNNKCLDNWYGQTLAGKYKNHCFYEPENGICQELY